MICPSLCFVILYLSKLIESYTHTHGESEHARDRGLIQNSNLKKSGDLTMIKFILHTVSECKSKLLASTDFQVSLLKFQSTEVSAFISLTMFPPPYCYFHLLLFLVFSFNLPWVVFASLVPSAFLTLGAEDGSQSVS